MYHDFVRLLFLNAHREASAFAEELPPSFSLNYLFLASELQNFSRDFGVRTTQNFCLSRSLFFSVCSCCVRRFRLYHEDS